MLRLCDFNLKYLSSSDFNRCLNDGGKKTPHSNKTSVCFQTSTSHAKVVMVVGGRVYVFFSHAFVKTTYLFKKSSFSLKQFAAALSVLAGFQLKVEDGYFFTLRTPVSEIRASV